MNKKKLVTTDVGISYKNGQEVDFLGEWCKPYAKKSLWENASFNVLNYHWDDREKLYQDSIEIQHPIDKFSTFYGKRLNEIHGLDWSEQSWRIVLYPWLTLAISCLFDRFHSILNLEHGIYQTEVYGNVFDLSMVPSDYSESVKWFVGCDLYNHLIYSAVIKTCRKDIDIIHATLPESFEISSNKRGGCSPDRLTIKKLLRNMLTLPRRFNKKIVCDSTGFKPFDMFKLLLRLRSVPYYDCPNIKSQLSLEFNVDSVLRKKLLPINAGNESVFDTFLGKVLPASMPKSYLECFKARYERLTVSYPKKCKIILTSSAHYTNDDFKIFSAYATNKGAKLIVSQHGGHYGTGKFSLMDNVDECVSDRYCVWGWSKPGCDKHLKMPAIKLINTKRTKGFEKYGDIVIPMFDIPRYSYYVFSVPVSGQLSTHYKDLFTCISSLEEGARNRVNMRIPESTAAYYKNDISGRVNDFDKNIKVSDTSRPFKKFICESSLCIATYNATTYLETLHMNHPTVIIWNPEYFELRDEAKPFFDELREAKILFYDMQAAAKHINKIYLEPMSWWSSRSVQMARETFCSQYAFCPENSLAAWGKYLQSEIRSIKD